MDAMDGRRIDGRELRVQMARYGRPETPPYRRRRRRYFVFCLTDSCGQREFDLSAFYSGSWISFLFYSRLGIKLVKICCPVKFYLVFCFMVQNVINLEIVIATNEYELKNIISFSGHKRIKVLGWRNFQNLSSWSEIFFIINLFDEKQFSSYLINFQVLLPLKVSLWFTFKTQIL